MSDRQQIEQALAVLEAQRPALGDAVVDASQAALRKQLAELDPAPPGEQRKLVTLLFADLVGFTALASSLDPEEVRAIQQAYFAAVSAPIKQYGGLIEKYIGDAVVAIFGLPQAEENDPDRAVHAALEMQTALVGLNSHLAKDLGLQLPDPLQMRIGINTGLVVVSLSPSGDFDMLGDSVNLASRLQSAAPVGGVLISQDTYRHVRGAFDLQALDPITVKGKPEALQVYRVTAAKLRSFRTRKRGVEGIDTRMIGRQSELQSLQTAYFNAIEANERTVVVIVADPGLGKSRLIYEFENWVDLRPERVRLFRGRSRLETQRLPFGLWRDLFAFRFGIQDDDPLSMVWQKFETGLAEISAGDSNADNQPKNLAMPAHFIGQLLGYDFSASPHLQGVKNDPQQIQERATEYLTDYFKSSEGFLTVMILLEDLHWADDASLNLIHTLALRLADQPLLIVATARPVLFERREHWLEGHDFYLRLDLHPLSKRDSRRLVDDVLQKVQDIPEALRDLIVLNAEGNPFYVEELVKMLIEEGVIVKDEQNWQVLTARLSSIHVPSTLTGVLQARLDSLSEAEHILIQQASVVGRVFWDRTLAYLNQAEPNLLDSTVLSQELAELRQKEMIYRRENSTFTGAQEYIFKHAMLREVAYEHLLKRLRREYHQRTADWLVEATQACGRVAEYTSLIAEHYFLAGQMLEAADWLTLAGERALKQGAIQEAGSFFERALNLLPADEGERRWRTLKGRGSVLSLLSQREALEVLNAELLALAQKLNNESHLAEANYRLASSLAVHGDDRTAVQTFQAALPQARRSGDRVIEAKTLALLSISLVRLGEKTAAEEAADQAIQVALQTDDLNAQAQVLVNTAVCYVEIGDLAKGVHTLSRSQETYQHTGDIVGLALVLSNLGYNYVRLGLVEQGRTTLERAIRIQDEIGARREQAYSGLNLGLADIRSGNLPTALQTLQHYTEILSTVGDEFGQAAGITYQALAHEAAGDFATAAAHFDQAMEIHRRIGMVGYAIDAQAGLARCALARRQLGLALQQADQVWRYLCQHNTAGMEFPTWAYLTCALVFQAAGETDRFRTAVSTGIAQLIEKADKISSPEWRKSYLENVPEHRAILTMSEE